MHPALQIQEILLNIFGHCCPPGRGREASDLPALARTCRAFKEPALDVLWEELLDPSPIARCLPEASHHAQTAPLANQCYSFSRSLTRVEWCILRNYTCRIRSMRDCNHAFTWESVRTFLNPATTEPLFPNLRYLRCDSETHAKHMLYLPFPSLISLHLEFIANQHALQGSLESFSKFSPNIRILTIQVCYVGITFGNFFFGCISRWRDIQSVLCGDITLDVEALASLSRMPALAHLAFTLSATLPEQITSSDLPLSFPNLQHLTLHSEFLDPISRLLFQTQLPSTTDFAVFIAGYPCRQDVSSFLAAVHASRIGCAVQDLWLSQHPSSHSPYTAEDLRPVLGLEDLRPCMAFSNLRRINLNIKWRVDLTDSELLALASAWPLLERLSINARWGWKTLGGITPNGLLLLLQTCRSLCKIALAVDTRGYTEFRPLPANFGLTLPSSFCIDVVDSTIEAESVPAIAAFLACIASRCDFSFRACRGSFNIESVYMIRWYEAYERANNILTQRL